MRGEGRERERKVCLLLRVVKLWNPLNCPSFFIGVPRQVPLTSVQVVCTHETVCDLTSVKRNEL